jgi:glycosyltransferase involved in cell wall biosynthesis
MRVLVATVQVPFISGGAEIMVDGLCSALSSRGHQVEKIQIPFRFGPPSEVEKTMGKWESEDFDRLDAGPADRLIALKFPAFYAKHQSKYVWLMHQHRSCYELWNTKFGESENNPNAVALREKIIDGDNRNLADAKRIYTISQTVSDRLLAFNQIKSEPLLQPPAGAERFYTEDYLPYIFVPSRIEELKRQRLIIEAMGSVDKRVFAVIAGDGGQREAMEKLAQERGLGGRIIFLGRVDDATMKRWYANSLAVFFGPIDEDYGFITLEAMLSSKAVITCVDSGGPLSFVQSGVTGFVCAPDCREIAEKVNLLYANRKLAIDLGAQGRSRYKEMDINWENIVDKLTSTE